MTLKLAPIVLLFALLLTIAPDSSAFSPEKQGLPLSSINSNNYSEIDSDPFIPQSHQLVYAPSAEHSAFFLNESLFFLSLLSLVGIFLFWYRNNFYVTLLFIVVTIALVDRQIENLFTVEKAQTTKLDLIQEIGSVSARLEGVLQTNLSMLTGFSAYISAVPALSNEEFDNYAKELFKKEPLLINFAAAKDLVVNYVYPLQGNEKVIGLDYNRNDAQKKLALQVASTGKLMVVGPINLVQGGTAFIGRAPIFTGENDNRKFWGIISAPLDEFALYQEAGLGLSNQNFEIAIKSYDSLGNEGQVFFGDPKTFSSKERVEYSIQVGGGNWHIAATSRSGASQIDTYVLTVRISSVLAALLVVSFAYFRIRQKAEKQKLENTIVEHRRLLEKVGSVARIGGWKIDSNKHFTQWTTQTSEAIGIDSRFLPNKLKDLESVFIEEDYVRLADALNAALTQSRPIDLDLKMASSTATERWIRVLAKPSKRSQENLVITGTFQDVTDKVISAKLIEHQATYDSLTDLPNRVLFNDRLNKAIEDAKRNNTKLGVLFIDLDRFKPVNDNYGHQTGDRLLINTSRRIKKCIRDSDTVSRISGDEFCVLLANLNEYSNVTKITENILHELEAPYQLEDTLVHCGASIGISLFPEDGETAQSLISKADQAMYQVKSKGRNDWQFYTKEMQIESERRHRLLNELILDLKEQKLLPHFQPVYDLKTDKICKCEALARWPKADGSFVPPNEFINLAEESGLINKLDLYMLESSAKLIEHLKQSVKDVELSINVSPRLFHNKAKDLGEWLDCVKNISAKISLTVEITERLLTEDSIKALEVLNQIKELGVKIAIDDFGTGYSSLSYLVKFPVDIIKIDREFVDKLTKDKTTDALIETILLMARRLEIKVIAEGIEDSTQLQRLKQLGCDFGQGYHLGRPVDFEQFSRSVAEELVE